MNYDPTGHFTIMAMLISIGVSLLFEVADDAIDGGLGDGSHDWKDYLGAAVSGFFGGLSGGIAAQAVFSLAGGFADAAISGDLVENGIWNTLGSIAVSSVLSITAGSISKFVGSKIKASSLRKLGSNNAANKVLGRMGIAGKIGNKSNSALSKMIRNSNWIGNIIADTGAASIVGGIVSIGWGHIFGGMWF